MIHFFLFFFNTPPTTYIYTLSLHDALPILSHLRLLFRTVIQCSRTRFTTPHGGEPASQGIHFRAELDHLAGGFPSRSEEHTSELQSHSDLVCRLLLEKKKNQDNYNISSNRK